MKAGGLPSPNDAPSTAPLGPSMIASSGRADHIGGADESPPPDVP